LTYELELKGNFSESIEQYCHSELQRVTESAPFESACTGLLERIPNDRARFRIQVMAKACHFAGDAETANPKESIDQAVAKVMEEIAEWKRHRFEDQMIDTYKSAG